MKGHRKMHIAVLFNTTYVFIINCPDSAGRRGHGLENQSLGIFDTFNSYGRNIFFATIKIFGRLCSEVPKVKYRHEFTKGDNAQSNLKEVISFV